MTDPSQNPQKKKPSVESPPPAVTPAATPLAAEPVVVEKRGGVARILIPVAALVVGLVLGGFGGGAIALAIGHQGSTASQSDHRGGFPGDRDGDGGQGGMPGFGQNGTQNGPPNGTQNGSQNGPPAAPQQNG